jgi:para-nitrobenzyl esterase
LKPTKIYRRTLLGGLAGAGALHALGRSASALAASTKSAPIATTASGKVRGIAARNVLSFRAIPYGGPCTGTHRFMPASAPIPWQGIRDAVNAGARAIQASNGTIFTSPLLGEYFSGGRPDAVKITAEPDSENCLVLNVLTTNLSGKRAVMVYIHGGGFTEESGALTLISDRFVLEQDIVLVGINHRLGVFGYTYLGALDPKYADSGNLGQLDLIQALKWVRDNIANFGGDPTNVTLFGESGGGAKISALLAMPGAKGLFRRAIIESGSFRSVRTMDTAAEGADRFLKQLKLSASQLGQLQTLPAAQLLAAYRTVAKILDGPVIDQRSLSHQTWQQGAPPEANGVSLLIGCCKDETTLFALQDPALFALDWPGLKEREIKSGIPASAVDAILEKYRQDYSDDSPSDLYFRMATDKGFRSNAIAQAEAKLAQDSGTVHMYYFAWNTGLAEGKLRAFHTAELPLAMRLVANPQAEELSRQIAGAWASFARNGDPNHASLPHWEKYSLEKRATLVFDAGRTAPVDHPAQEELALLAPFPKGVPYDDAA